MRRINYSEIKDKLEAEDDFFIDDEPISCILYEEYISGQLKYEKIIINAVLDGFYNEYYEDGTIKIKGNYQKAKRVNEWSIFHASGGQKQIIVYKHGVISSYKIWNKKGLLIEELKTNLDQESMNTQEQLTSWHKNGNLKTSIIAEYGIIMKKEEWDDKNQLILDYQFTDFNYDMLYL
jgi:antitoxin component YwqK of YwqJK toxin-antitoxin module